jgi:catechol 2,3-dioxygenase-like lactoylglutathione lyase family enzyme
MAVMLDHTIVAAREGEKTAAFFTEILGLPAAHPFGPFLVLEAANGVSLDVLQVEEEFEVQHYAFRVTETEFDAIFGRIRSRGLPYWADPARSVADQINHRDGGRGVYFEDPNGHVLEILTRRYGSGGWDPAQAEDGQ